METLDRYGVSPEAAWVAALLTAVAAIAGAALAFTERIYYGFLWRYFWGPVHADAINANCLVYVRETGRIVNGNTLAAGCSRATANFVAEPGYTLVSEAGYAITLVFMLAGVYLLLQRLDLEPYREFFYALVPFMLFGGALRVVEDAFDAGLRSGLPVPLDYPGNTIFISPLIYFTVFFLAFGSLLIAKHLQRRGYTDTYHYPLGAIGVGVAAVTVGYLTWLSATTAYVGFYPGVFVVTMGLASLIAVGAYLLLERVAPWANEGTRYMGIVIVWAHAVDGVANVIASDWATAFGLASLYGSKHPVDRILSGFTRSIQGPELTAMVGDSWMFLVVKVVVAVAILAIFEEEFLEDSPRYAVVLLAAIVAVGLGPGTRDMIRVTFGI
jgi:uncharacterized membrane protein